MATSGSSERYAPHGGCQGRRPDPPCRAAALPGVATFPLGGAEVVGRRGIKEYRAPEALALIAADREHIPLVCPSCGTRSIESSLSPRRRGERTVDRGPTARQSTRVGTRSRRRCGPGTSAPCSAAAE